MTVPPRPDAPRLSLVLALATVLLVVAAGCGNSDGSTGPTDLPPGASSGPSAETPAPATAESDAVVASAILGSWLPKPIAPSLVERHAATVEAACHSAMLRAGGDLATLASAPPVVADFRGLGQAWLLFSDGTRAAGCRAGLGPDLAVTTTDVEALMVPGAAPADDGFEYVAYGVLNDVDSGRTFAIGRMGRLSVDVIVTFPDESFTFATLGGGWYLVWWPGNVVPVGIGGVDSRHLTVKGLAPPVDSIP